MKASSIVVVIGAVLLALVAASAVTTSACAHAPLPRSGEECGKNGECAAGLVCDDCGSSSCPTCDDCVAICVEPRPRATRSTAS